MAPVVSINGIDEAIKNLDDKAKDSAKLRLIRAIRPHYAGGSALTILQTIDPDTLVRQVWDIAFDDHRLQGGDCCKVEEIQLGDTTPVDAHLEAAAPFWIADALGNGMEWTLDRNQSGENSHGLCYIAEGGSWASPSDTCLYSRFKREPDIQSDPLGFRGVAF